MLIDPELWTATRAGARAGRGFRYQDVATALLAVQAWAGATWTAVVPEGVDDVTLHGPNRELRVQVKSRHDPRGTFTAAEIGTHIAHTAANIPAGDLRAGRVAVALLLERPADKIAPTGLDAVLAEDPESVQLLSAPLASVAGNLGLPVAELLASTHLLVTPDPADIIVELISARTGCVEAAGRLIADRLRQLAGAAADANYRASPRDPATLDATLVQRVVDDVLANINPAAVLAAVSSGLCEPVSFAAVEAPGFYEGVDVVPGHIGAGLVLDRPETTAEIARGLQRRRAILVAGPSGSGKSACAWLAAHEARHSVRWYRVRRAPPDQVHTLLDLARAIEATAERPVGFVFDDLGRELAGGWDELRRAAVQRPGILILGTVREEDLFLVDDLAGVALVRPVLDEDLAVRVWTALRETRELAFVSWREPFERSLGLMLEYVHMLTSGERLQETLDAQVRRRLREGRDNEIAVLAAVAEAARLGGSVDAGRLRASLSLAAGAFDRALTRLVDEHAIRVSGDGTLTGLHEIRSAGLHDALRRMAASAAGEARGTMVDALAPRSFATVLPRLIAEGAVADTPLLDALAHRAASLDPSDLASLSYGLGLATCDRIAERWLAIAAEEGIDARLASFALTFAIAGTTFDMPQFAKLDAAVARRGELRTADLRVGLLRRFGDLGHLRPSLAEYHDLAASFAPIPFAATAPPFELLPGADAAGAGLDDIVEILATARTLGPERAARIVERFGGTEALLDRLHRERAWITRPTLRREGDELVVSSDVRYVDPAMQGDANDAVVAHCEGLLAAAPRADVVASTMIGWDGRPAGLAGLPVASKRIPRDNLLPPVAVAWNRAMMRAVQRRHAATTESGRANALSVAISELARLLADAAELQCRGSTADGRAMVMVAIRTLLNSFIEPSSAGLSAGSARDQGVADMNDELHTFVSALTDLVRELGAGDVEHPLVKAAEVARLKAAADRLSAAPEWRWLDDPPHAALSRLADLLDDLDAVLGLAHGDPAEWRSARLRAERSSRSNRTLPRFAADARDRARASADRRVAAIADALASEDRRVLVARRPADPDALTWPRLEFLALVPVDHLATFMTEVETLVVSGRHAADGHALYLAPVREGMVVGMLAGMAAAADGLTASSFPSGFIPDASFDRWATHLPLPTLEERSAAAFHDFTSIAVQLSSVMANADRLPNDEEMAYAQGLVDRMRERAAELGRVRDENHDQDMAIASEFALDWLRRLGRELDGDDGGESIAAETARLGFGEGTEERLRGPLIRIGLVERDILAAAAEREAGRPRT